MKKAVLFLYLILSINTLNAQKIRFKVSGEKDTLVNLIKYFGKGLYYADTAAMKNGVVTFDGSKQKPGILGLLLSGQRYFEFVYDNEYIDMETSGPEFVKNMKVIKSEENKVFIPYVDYITTKKTEAGKLGEERSKFTDKDPQFKTLGNQIDAINKDVEEYQAKLMNLHKDKLVSKIVKMSTEVTIPEAPVDAKGNIIDSSFRFNYYRKHYWDNVDLLDERLVNNPVFHNKLEYYFSKNMMIQHWDTVLVNAFEFCDRLNPKSRTFEYVVGWITSTYGKSQIMGMDKVYYMMLERYYCSKDVNGKSPAYWVPDDKFKDLCDNINNKLNIVLGVRPPNLILRDTTDAKWVDLYAVDAEYTILYFWDPECGHCKKVTPKLEKFYQEKLKARNVQIYSVGKAIGKDFEAWKKFVRENKLTFINVAVTDNLYELAKNDPNSLVPVPGDNRPKPTTLESLNYQTAYDIFSTPKAFILDKDKKIIAKSLSLSQMEDLLDRLQGQKDAPKLFPPDAEEDAQMQKKE